MAMRTPRQLIVLAALALFAPLFVHAQAPAPAPAAAPAGGGQAALSQDQLDSLLAPVALYPDELLAQVLMASTYPLDIVQAARFIKANPNLKGDALVKQVENQPWDVSVQSLTSFPQVIDMMNEKLDWTQQLGDAYLADQAAVMKTVQGLRAKAQANGNLKSNEQQKVVSEGQTIIIQPAQPQVVYVPTYNPTVVYGSWWAPAYPPYYYPPPPAYYPGYGLAAGMIGFGIGWAIGSSNWGWCNTNWGGNNVNINVDRNNAYINHRGNDYKNNIRNNNGNWNHNPAQRKGVAYNNAATRDKYRGVDNNAVSSRRDYRGDTPGGNRGGPGTGQGGQLGGGAAQRPSTMDRPGGGPQAGTMDRPGGGGGGQQFGGGSAGTRQSNFGGGSDFGGSNARQQPSFNSSQSRGQAQQYSNRGAQSRSSMGGGASRPSGGGGARGGGGGGRGGGGGGRGR